MIKLLIIFIKKLKVFLSKKLSHYNVTLPYAIALVLALLIGVFGINIFVELTEVLSTETLANYDTKITSAVLSHRSTSLTKYFTFITHVGDVYGYLVVLILSAIISLVVFKRWKYMVQITLVLFLSALSNVVLKRVINRARPDLEHLVTVETLSYPSGHAMSAMAFYGFLIYLFYRFKMNRYIKIGTILVLAFLILSIGVSRIYLGVHYPSDILGGFIAGAIWVVFCIVLFNLIEVFRSDPKTPNNI
jgi:undecaprenyl-diphosphatase